MHARALTVALLLATARLTAQPGTITTVMGAYPLGDGLQAPKANFTRIQGLALDQQGRLLISETNRYRRVDSDGRVSTILGTGIWSVPTIGPVREMLPGEPIGTGQLAVGPAGEIFGSNGFINSCGPRAGVIWSFDPSANLVRVLLRADPCGARALGDGGPAAAAYAAGVESLAVDSLGRIYFSDSQLNLIRRIDPDGSIQPVAGTSVASAEGDGGPALKAGLRTPVGLALSADGELYIADSGNARIRKVSADGIISTFAPMPNVRRVAVSKPGGLLATDGFVIRRIEPSGDKFVQIYSASAKGRRFMSAMIEDRDGSILVADDAQVFRLNADGSDVGIVAGVEPDAGKAGPPEFAKVIGPVRTVPGPDGELWFQDGLGIRKRTAAGAIETVTPSSVSFAVSSDGVVYISMGNRLERFVDGRRSVFVAADRFQSNGLRDLVVNSAGDVIVADLQNHKVLKIDRTGETIKAIAGTGKAVNTGDGGPATEADVNAPIALTLGPGDALYISTQGGIRKIAPDGIISTLTGGATACGFIPDFVVATKVGNCQFGTLAVDPKGDLFFQNQDRIYRLRGANVIRVAGLNRGYSGDGATALNALLQGPQGLSVSSNGDLFIADNGNHRIRRVQGYSPFLFGDESVAFAGSLGGAPVEERVTVSSADGETHNFRVSITYPAGRTGWLTVTPVSGQLAPEAPISFRFIANLQGMPKGVYSARVRLIDTQSEEYSELPVTLLVSGTPQQLRLSRTGFTFVAVQAGPAPPAQTLGVVNSGRGALPFTVATSTLSGGEWLSATPPGGTADASTQPLLSVRVNSAGLPPGVYFGLVTVNSTVADNAPQSAVVLLQVLGTGQAPSPIVDPAGLIFTSNAPQSITLGNVRTATSTFTIAAPSFPDRRTWFTLPLTALTGSILPGQTAQVQIRPAIDGIPPGQYRAQLSIRFTPDNLTRVVELLLVIANSPGASTKLNAAGACKPTKLLPIFQQPGGGFAATAGWPQLVQLRVVDDCQEPQTKGRVRISFNNGDPALALTPQAEGVWTGTWSPGRVATRIDLSARAESFEPDLLGVQAVTGGLRDDANRPRIVPGGVFSEASLKKLDPVAVGSNITVQGVRMASAKAGATTTTLPSRLGETTVLLAGKPLGLRVAAEGEIRGLIPFTVADATIQQMIVQRGSSYSLPEPVLVAPVQPAVYTVDGTGRGAGEIYIDVDDLLVPVDGARPAIGGEDVTIIATGLGAVDPKVPDGAAGAADPVSNVLASLRVQIQGKEATVKSATLAPGKPGRYWIVVTVPADVAPDASARVVLTVADQAVSSPVTMSVTKAVE